MNLLIPVFLNCFSSFFIFVAKSHLAFFCTMILIIVLKNTFYSYTSACVMAICVVTQVRFHPRKAVWEFHSTSISFNFQFVPSFLLFPRWLSTCGIYMHCWKVCYTQTVKWTFGGTHLRLRPYNLTKLRICILPVHLQTFQILIGEYTTPKGDNNIGNPDSKIRKIFACRIGILGFESGI